MEVLHIAVMFLNLVCNLFDIAPTHPHTQHPHKHKHTRILKRTLPAYFEDGAHFLGYC